MSYLLVVAGSLAAEADVAPPSSRADWGGAGGVKEEDCNDDTTPATTLAMVAGSMTEAVRQQQSTCRGDEGQREYTHAVGHRRRCT